MIRFVSDVSGLWRVHNTCHIVRWTQRKRSGRTLSVLYRAKKKKKPKVYQLAVTLCHKSRPRLALDSSCIISGYINEIVGDVRGDLTSANDARPPGQRLYTVNARTGVRQRFPPSPPSVTSLWTISGSFFFATKKRDPRDIRRHHGDRNPFGKRIVYLLYKSTII